MGFWGHVLGGKDNEGASEIQAFGKLFPCVFYQPNVYRTTFFFAKKLNFLTLHVIFASEIG
jgi:hypothetical protein